MRLRMSIFSTVIESCRPEASALKQSKADSILNSVHKKLNLLRWLNMTKQTRTSLIRTTLIEPHRLLACDDLLNLT